MEKFVSLNNSSESLEKSISLVYTSYISDENFYSDKQQYVFYGHNLPKISKSINVCGTVGFYLDKYYDCDWSPVHSYEELWNMRRIIIDKLIISGKLSIRTAEKIFCNRQLYNGIISKIPVDYIFEDYYLNLISLLRKKYPDVSFKKINLEKNIKEIYTTLPDEKKFYSIYGLESDGRVGHYYMQLDENNSKYMNRLLHLYSDLQKRIVLSGNVGILIASIDYNMQNEDYILGYRERKKHIRQTRNYALDHIYPYKRIIEPKNYVYNSYYDFVANSLNEEKMSNEVVAKVFKKVIKEMKY